MNIESAHMDKFEYCATCFFQQGSRKNKQRSNSLLYCNIRKKTKQRANGGFVLSVSKPYIVD